MLSTFTSLVPGNIPAAHTSCSVGTADAVLVPRHRVWDENHSNSFFLIERDIYPHIWELLCIVKWHKFDLISLVFLDSNKRSREDKVSSAPLLAGVQPHELENLLLKIVELQTSRHANRVKEAFKTVRKIHPFYMGSTVCELAQEQRQIWHRSFPSPLSPYLVAGSQIIVYHSVKSKVYLLPRRQAS